ncbi:hypothetical protein [Paraburkholderia hospita]|uniref:hypothetical protein n=1 Tax=Paraburkholderia hospita TaxID=169430 RepID=UPI0008A7631A|nr:hypothetical protein [Paraburkholderia hospita]SEI22144.1 hypothetical protein SAMN05192544_104268 [Paraburkholderia hospita]
MTVYVDDMRAAEEVSATGMLFVDPGKIFDALFDALPRFHHGCVKIGCGKWNSSRYL